MPFSSYFPTYTLDVGLGPVAEVLSVGCVRGKLPFSPFLNHAVWEEVTMHNPHLRLGVLCSSSPSTELLRKLFGILLRHRFVLSPSFIYSFDR